MYWDNIRRIAIYTFLILLSIAVVVGAAALFIQMVGLGDAPETESASETETEETTPPKEDTKTPETTKTPEAETSPSETETSASPEDTAAKVTAYGETKTMYALYNVNARMSYTTDSDIMGLVYQGDAVKVTGETDNGWYRVDYRGYTAYIRCDLLTEDAGEAAVEIEAYDKAVTMYASADVNVRESHSTNSKVFETIKAGTEVTVTGKTSNGWYRIDYNGGMAYINDEYLAKEKPIIDDREA